MTRTGADIGEENGTGPDSANVEWPNYWIWHVGVTSLESLKIGAKEMLDVKGIHDPDVRIVVPPVSLTAG